MQNVFVGIFRLAGSSYQDRVAFLEEIETMKSVGQHPNIVNIIGSCTVGPQLCLIIEHCKNGDLQSYLRQLRSKVCLVFHQRIEKNK